MGSQVVFKNGTPAKSFYRRYNIEGLGNNDFASLAQLLERRLKKEDAQAPDLLLIDGGKAQLQAVLKIVKDLKVSVDVISLAKERASKGSSERIFIPRRVDPIELGSHPAYKILIQLRDEAHRFAITGHRKRRDKHLMNSALLQQTKGLGPKRYKELMDKLFDMGASPSKQQLKEALNWPDSLIDEIFKTLTTEEKKAQ